MLVLQHDVLLVFDDLRGLNRRLLLLLGGLFVGHTMLTVMRRGSVIVHTVFIALMALNDCKGRSTSSIVLLVLLFRVVLGSADSVLILERVSPLTYVLFACIDRIHHQILVADVASMIDITLLVH